MVGCNPIVTPASLASQYATSNVATYDGSTLNCILGITVGGSSLNDVIEAIDTAICSMTNSVTSNIQYDGADPLGTCNIDLTDGGNLNDILLDFANYMCNHTTSISSIFSQLNSLNTGLITLENGYTNCVGTFTTATTVTEWMEAIQDLLCTNTNEISTATADRVSQGTVADTGTTFVGVTDVKEWIRKGGDINYVGMGLTPSIEEATTGITDYVYYGKSYSKPNDTVTLVANRDNYIDFDTVSEDYIVTDVAIGDPAPALAGMRLHKATTDATDVIATEDLRNFYNNDGTRLFDDAIVTRHITDESITGAKLEVYATAGTVDFGFGTFDVDDKGRVNNYSSDVNISGLADGQVLQYSTGSGKWENIDVAGGLLPAATADGQTMRYDGAVWTADGFLTNKSGSVGLGAAGSHGSALQIGNSGEIVFELATPTAPVLAGVLGGTLVADTYYYAVTAIDSLGGETVLGTEDNITIDGIGETQVDLSWSVVPSAVSYRVYKGVASGTYTEYFSMALNAYSDDGTAGTVVVSTPTGTSAYLGTINQYGIGYGVAPSDSDPFAMVDSLSIVSVANSVLITGADYTSDVVGYKSFITNTNTADNVAGWFKSTGGANNYALRLEDGVDNTGKFLQVLDATGNVGYVASSYSLGVQEEGSTIESSVNTINFVGGDITATSGGAGVVNVTLATTASGWTGVLTSGNTSGANDVIMSTDLGDRKIRTANATTTDQYEIVFGDGGAGSDSINIKKDTGNGGYMYLVDTEAQLGHGAGNQIKVDSTSIKVVGVGLSEAADYSGSYTALSYTSKGYVDTAISTAGSGYLNLTGGTMTGAITLTSGEAMNVVDNAYINLSTNKNSGLQYQSAGNEVVLYNNNVGGNVALDGGQTGLIKFEHDGTPDMEFSDGALAINKTYSLTFGLAVDSFYGNLVSSTITTSDKTWTLPDATGTVALTSDLSSYLSLSGGTMTGAIEMNQEKLQFNNDGFVFAQYNTDGQDELNITNGNGQVVASGFGVKAVNLELGWNTGSALNISSSFLTADRTVQFQDAAGTVALTSDLGAYLPLAGGTMTGDVVMDTSGGDILMRTNNATAASRMRILFDDGGAGTDAIRIGRVSGSTLAEVFLGATIDIQVGNQQVTMDGTSTTVASGVGGSKWYFSDNVRPAITDPASVYAVTLDVDTLTASRTISFPNATGTVALTSDLTGDGIYDGSGTVPSSAIATLTDTLTFTGGDVKMEGLTDSNLFFLDEDLDKVNLADTVIQASKVPFSNRNVQITGQNLATNGSGIIYQSTQALTGSLTGMQVLQIGATTGSNTALSLSAYNSTGTNYALNISRGDVIANYSGINPTKVTIGGGYGRVASKRFEVVNLDNDPFETLYYSLGKQTAKNNYMFEAASSANQTDASKETVGFYGSLGGASTVNAEKYGYKMTMTPANGNVADQYGAYVHLTSSNNVTDTVTNYGYKVETYAGGNVTIDRGDFIGFEAEMGTSSNSQNIDSFVGANIIFENTVGSTIGSAIGLQIDMGNSEAVATTAYAMTVLGGAIGVGTATPDASALVEFASTTQGVLMPRMTHTEAGAITGVNGLVIYVTSTDATFTAVGFWGYEAGAWVKL